eukprot:221603-Chlamydomonas_euryale.AAC.1
MHAPLYVHLCPLPCTADRIFALSHALLRTFVVSHALLSRPAPEPPPRGAQRMPAHMYEYARTSSLRQHKTSS